MELNKNFGAIFTTIVFVIGFCDNCEAAVGSEMKIIDMSHPFQNNTIYWPGSKHFKLTNTADGYNEGIQNWLYMNNYEASEHGGTHMDAPAHFVEGRWAVDEIPVERFVFPAVVIDITAKASADPDAQVTVEDLEAWEDAHGEIPHGAGVFMHSGWAKRWPDEETYLGNADKDTSNMHFPGFSLEAAVWLTENRYIYAIGVDTPSPDVGKSTTYPVHVQLLGHDIYIIENVNSLDKLPPSGARVYAFPMKIAGGSGAPMRVMAFTGNPLPPDSGNSIASASMMLFMAIALMALFQ